MRKERERRYASVAVFSEDIVRYLDGRPVDAHADSFRYRAGKFVRRNRLAVTAAVAVALSLIGGIAATTLQARRAERRFGVARQLARAVMADVSGPLAQLPGATAARESMIETVVRYLDELSGDRGTDSAFDLELAAAYREVGSVQAHPSRPNLGRPTEALKNYGKALTLFEEVYDSRSPTRSDRAAALSGLIGTQIEAGDVETLTGNQVAALRRLREAETLAQEAVRGDRTLLAPGTAVYLYFRLGSLAARTGDPDAALKQFGPALTVSQQWDAQENSVNSRSTLRGAYANLAGVQLTAGDMDGGLKSYQAAMKEIERALAMPNATVYERSMLAHTHRNLANVIGNPEELNYGDRSAALAHCQAALEILENIASADPKDVRAQDDVADAYRSRGAILLDGRAAQARKDFQQALAISEKLSQLDPSNVGYSRDAGLARMAIGEALLDLGGRSEALSYLNAALSAWEPADSLQLSELAVLARIHLDLGNSYSATDRDRALEEYQKSLNLTAKLVKEAPRNRYFERQYADVLEALGRNYGAGPQARSRFEESLAIWRKWLSQGIARPYATVRERQATALMALAGRN